MVVLVLALLGGERLAAQTVLRSPPPLDSARASLRDAVLVLRDSLVTVDGAASRLQRDYRRSLPSFAALARANRCTRPAPDRVERFRRLAWQLSARK